APWGRCSRISSTIQDNCVTPEWTQPGSTARNNPETGSQPAAPSRSDPAVDCDRRVSTTVLESPTSSPSPILTHEQKFAAARRPGSRQRVDLELGNLRR